MGSTNIYSQYNIAFIKNLIDNNTPYADILRYSALTEEQLTQVITRLRSRESYRTYVGHSFFDLSLCNKEEYIKQMNYNQDAIVTDNDQLRILICSDMHLCSEADRPDLIDKVWDTAAELGINHIVNLGDVTEGVEYHIHTVKKSRIKIEPTIESQTMYLNRFIPSDKSIKHHILLGNHDLYSNDGLSNDIIKEINENYEIKDLTVSGIEDCLLPINNDHIHLIHRSYCNFVKEYLQMYEDEYENQIMFCGHAHLARTISARGYTMEYVPPLCDLPRNTRDYPFYIGFVILTLEFNSDKKIREAHIRRYRFDDCYQKPICFHNHDVVVRRLKK